MSKYMVPTLADAMRAYYAGEEPVELCGLFAETPEWDDARHQPARLSIAKRLITQMERGNNRRILEALLPSLFLRCSQMMSKIFWERRDFHQ